ncbi:MAG TPA: FAD-dependent oxidoreductase [Steroidobacteraceae bacterium]|nr:FAD-dependent oxidoreductase [Steroidobacteraceae bacterium]
MGKLIDTRRPQMFPVLTPAQLARLEAYGKKARVEAGEVLAQSGEREGRMIVIVSGSVEILRTGLAGEERITLHGPGEFTGEMSTLRGARSLVRARVSEAGEVLIIDHDNLRKLVQTDAELSELFMRAFILRRMGLIESESSDIILIGSRHSAGTLRLQQFLSRNGVPYHSVDIESDANVGDLLERFHVKVDEVPVVVCRAQKVLRNPSNEQLAECFGMNPQLDDAAVRDVLVIGAGPAGLAAAVYAASEGLDVLILETTAPGGQAGSSSKIENYLGFPTGISGRALAGRALAQAQKFGADVSIATSAVRLRCDRRPYEIELSNGHTVRARAVIIATGAEYRQLALANIDRFVGVGVYHAATYLESRLCADQEVIVVGGGNSAGQAAVYLSNGCRRVNILVRSGGLADSMSRYLIRRIEETPNITLRVRTELTALEGDDRLARVTWRSAADAAETTRDIGHVFLMTGAVPNTRWLQGCVPLDDKGFVRVGSDLRAEDLIATRWALPRAPYLMETGVPGIFAVGDVRSGSVKRVASAVGEGSISIQLVHRALQE